MPRRTPPVPLSSTNQQLYDDTYEMFGKDEADKFANSLQPYVAPAVVAPVTTAPAKNIDVSPIGTVPLSAPIAPVTDKLIYRPPPEVLLQKNTEAATKEINERTTMYRMSGMEPADAANRARKEVNQRMSTPRTVEYGSTPQPGAMRSDVATRGVELTPRLDTARTVVEAFKPQVLESEQQAEGRHRFELETARASKLLQEQAAASGKTTAQTAFDLLLSNNSKARQLAVQTYGDNPTDEEVKNIRDMLNAPIYAAAEELKKDSAGFAEKLSEMPSDILRGLTETEVRGQRVETKPAALMRGVAGLSRVALGGIKAGLMDPASKAAIAVSEGIPVMEVDARLQRDREQQGGASQTVSVNPFGAPIPVSHRSRIDTGDPIKDTAYEIATGRSAVDDYLDFGFQPQLALVAGIGTELLMPQTPIGWVTDIPGVAGALKPLGAIVGDAVKAPALHAFFSDTARSAKEVGIALEKPTVWQTISKAGDARTRLATDVAQQLSDVATLDKLTAEAVATGGHAETTAARAAADAADAAPLPPPANPNVARVFGSADNPGVPITPQEWTSMLAANAIRQHPAAVINNAIYRADDALARELMGNSISPGEIVTNSRGESLLIVSVERDANRKWEITYNGKNGIEKITVGEFLLKNKKQFTEINERIINTLEDAANAEEAVAQRADAVRNTRLEADAAMSKGIASPANKQLVDAIDKVRFTDPAKLSPTLQDIVGKLEGSRIDFQDAAAIAPELQKILRGTPTDPGIVTKIKTAGKGAQSDIIRNTYAVALKNPTPLGEINEAAVRAAIAETLEKIPDNGWAYLTPTLLVKKSVMAEKAFQSEIADAVSALPTGASMADVQKAIETRVKQVLKGKGSVAEPAALTPSRAESFLPSAPRGGLERLGTPGSRRAPVMEAAQDVSASATAIVDKVPFLRGKTNPAKRISDAFAGSQTVEGVKNTLESALKTRMPAATRNMIEKTRSEILSLGVNKTALSPGAKGGFSKPIKVGPISVKLPYVTPVVGAESGTLINAIRVQGGLDGYLTARIEADIAGGSLKAATHTAEVPVTRLKNLKPREAGKTADIVRGMVNEFFGPGPQGIGFVVSPNVQQRLTVITAKAVQTSDTAVEAVTQSIAELRKEFPGLQGVGRRSPGTLEDDVAGSALNYIIGSESKKIYADNFFEAYPELVFAPTTDAVRLRFEAKLNELGVSAAEKQSLLSKWDAAFDKPDVQKQWAQMSLDTAKEEFSNQAIGYSTRNLVVGESSPIGKLVDEFIGPDIAIGNPDAKLAALNAIEEATKSSVDALVAFATNSKLVRPINEQDVLALLAEGTSLPIGSTEKAVFESLIGNVDDLAAGTSSIADNLAAVRRNPEVMGWLSSGIRGAINQTRSLSLSGMTAGVALPNPKFFAMNYFSAGPMIAVTAPEVMARTVGAELGLPGTVRLHSVMAAAENPKIANEVAFTSTNGVTYTNRQLADFLNNNYFGMTEKDFSLGTKIGEDVRIAVDAAPSGMKGGVGRALADKTLRYLNVNGTNIYSRWANQVDINWRKQAFLNALEAGEAPNVAQRTASNAIFDYGRIPPALRQSVSKYISFMSFMAMSQAELLSTLVRPAAMKNLTKTISVQRDLNRGYGEWEYSSDADKQRMYGVYVGQDDDKQPTYFVGPASPLMGPLVDTTQLVAATYSLGETFAKSPGWVKPAESLFAKGAEQGFKALVDKMFTPQIGYAQNIGLIGDKQKSLSVPWQQVSYHQAMGKEHFGEWMREMGVHAVDYKDRKLGQPEFYGEQYEYNDDAAAKKAAGLDFMYVLAGMNRAVDDYEKMLAVSGQPLPWGDADWDSSGINLKKYGDNKALFYLQYALGGNLKKGTPEYEFYYQALRSEGFELAPR